MLKRIREKFGTAGLIVAIVALVVAVAGTAYAASGLNSTQKKQVKKIAKEFAGKDGVAGAPGSKGDPGSQGAKGDNGEKGAQGIPGNDGADGKSAVLVNETPFSCPSGGYTYEVEGSSVENEVCNGANGQDAGFDYLFSTNTENTDPGAGKLKLDNAAPGSATTVRVSETDNNTDEIAAAIVKWTSGPGAQGTLMIRKAGSPGTFAEYTISANADAGAYDNLTVVFVTGSGTFANEDPVTVAYWSAGTATLPTGATETGAWGYFGQNGGEEVVAPISLPIPLSTPLTPAQVHYSTEGDFLTFCGGGAGGPIVNNSHELCVYQAGVFEATFRGIVKASAGLPGGAENTGLSRQGGFVTFNAPTLAQTNVNGTFAVKG